MSLEKSQKSAKVEERIDMLNDYHTFAVYRSTCRALFEAHKLLFSFQMCVKILEAAGKLNMDEYQFFLKGGVVTIHSSSKLSLKGNKKKTIKKGIGQRQSNG